MTTLSAALEARDEPAYDDASATLLDALDWIAKALPFLKESREENERLLIKFSDENIRGVIQDNIDKLTALIAQAEGKEVGE